MRMVLFIVLCTLAYPVYASYSDGFLGAIIAFLCFPVALIVFAVTASLAAQNRFKDKPILNGYTIFWSLLALIVALMGSASSLDGSDSLSPIVIYIALSIYTLIALAPAFLQSMNSKPKETEK